ncbi:hypothetical protein ACTPEU_00360, partial [Clostridioides difficile]
LYKNGKILLVATSKPTVFAETILRYFDIDRYFKYIAGSNLDGAEIAREISDITISADNLNNLIVLKQISNKLMKRVDLSSKFI